VFFYVYAPEPTDPSHDPITAPANPVMDRLFLIVESGFVFVVFTARRGFVFVGFFGFCVFFCFGLCFVVVFSVQCLLTWVLVCGRVNKIGCRVTVHPSCLSRSFTPPLVIFF